MRPFPEVSTGRWQISTGGGTSPIWSSDGSELFYYLQGISATSDAILAVSVDSGPIFRPGTPEMLFQGGYDEPFDRGQFYDASLDGQQFLMIKDAGGANGGERSQIIIVENWFEELNRLAPTE